MMLPYLPRWIQHNRNLGMFGKEYSKTDRSVGTTDVHDRLKESVYIEDHPRNHEHRIRTPMYTKKESNSKTMNSYHNMEL